jgi:small subunit ribosomal protein S2
MADDTTFNKPQEDAALDEAAKAMVDAGVFYGRKRSKTNPRMKPYIAGNRNEIEIINIQQTEECLGKALAFLKEQVAKGGVVLFVGTQPPARGIEELAREFGFPVVTRRWIGGTLTNFKIISKRIEYFKKLRTDWEKQAFEHYTKKERVGIERELGRLTELLAGLDTLSALPAVLLVIDPNVHQAAVREARLLKIPIVSLVSTDGDPDLVDYPVPGNNKSQLSINWFLGEVRKALAEGRQAFAAAKAAAEKAAAEKQAEAGTTASPTISGVSSSSSTAV